MYKSNVHNVYNNCNNIFTQFVRNTLRIKKYYKLNANFIIDSNIPIERSNMHSSRWREQLFSFPFLQSLTRDRRVQPNLTSASISTDRSRTCRMRIMHYPRVTELNRLICTSVSWLALCHRCQSNSIGREVLPGGSRSLSFLFVQYLFLSLSSNGNLLFSFFHLLSYLHVKKRKHDKK